MLKRNTEKFIVGTTLAFASTTLWPIIKESFKPLAETGMQSAAVLTTRIQYALHLAKEEIEDIVAEAQFERMRKMVDQDIAEFNSTKKTGDT
ncbi:MAG: DUF5132 domain-containing protein [Gorillibacterium sp.]|nr:DUF5132 domain-containing protein [Gorillibacterium sp.]